MAYSAWRAATIASGLALTWSGAALADGNWWPAKVYNYDSGSQKTEDYTPLAKASKPWNICVLFPHMKDTFWVAADYVRQDDWRRWVKPAR